MGILSFFQRRKEPENFETVLEELRLSIASRRQRLQEMKLRERRATLWTTLYLFAAWTLYAGIWYAGWIDALAGVHTSSGSTMLWKKTVTTAPVIVGPVIILFTRRIVQTWYTRIANAEEKTLKDLMLEQRAKLEDLKKKTDFYSTQKLLERYDRPEGAAPNPNAPNPANATPARQGPIPAGRASLGGAPPPGGVPSIGPNFLQTPVRQNGAGPGPAVTPTPMHPGYMSAVSPVPIVPTPRRWYDRLADAVLGEDGDGAPGGGAQNKYALICKKCFTHNGLVRESEVDETQFICMKCGHLNPSPKSLRGEQHTPQSKDLASRLSASPISPSPSLTASAMGPPAAAPGLASRKGYRIESDVDDATDGADGMDVVPKTPAAKTAKGRKSSVASTATAAAAAPGIKRSGSGRMTRNSRKSEVGEGMEVD